MSIKFNCPCGTLYDVADNMAGKKVKCKTCQQILIVPEPELQIAEEPAYAQPNAPATPSQPGSSSPLQQRLSRRRDFPRQQKSYGKIIVIAIVVLVAIVVAVLVFSNKNIFSGEIKDSAKIEYLSDDEVIELVYGKENFPRWKKVYDELRVRDPLDYDRQIRDLRSLMMRMSEDGTAGSYRKHHEKWKQENEKPKPTEAERKQKETERNQEKEQKAKQEEAERKQKESEREQKREQEAKQAKAKEKQEAEKIAAIRADKLIDKYGGVNGRDDDGNTPLHEAVRDEYSYEISKILIAKGVDVNAKNNDNTTPVIIAIRDETLLNLLISKGADLNAKDKRGRTVINSLSEFFHDENEFEKWLKLFVNNGANINDKNENGKTLLDIAIDQEKVKVIELLRKYGAKKGNQIDGTKEVPDKIKPEDLEEKAKKLVTDCQKMYEEKKWDELGKAMNELQGKYSETNAVKTWKEYDLIRRANASHEVSSLQQNDIQKLFAGKVKSWDAKTRQIEIAYDFGDKNQLNDWESDKILTSDNKGMLIQERSTVWFSPKIEGDFTFTYDITLEANDIRILVLSQTKESQHAAHNRDSGQYSKCFCFMLPWEKGGNALDIFDGDNKEERPKRKDKYTSNMKYKFTLTKTGKSIYCQRNNEARYGLDDDRFQSGFIGICSFVGKQHIERFSIKCVLNTNWLTDRWQKFKTEEPKDDNK